MTFTFIYSFADAKQRYYLAPSDLIDILNSLYQFASVSFSLYCLWSTPIEIPHLSATMRSWIAFHGAAHNANTFLLKNRRSISLQQDPTKYGQLRSVSATRYDFPYHAVRRDVSRTYNKQCRSCTQWRRNAKNRSARSTAARLGRLYKTRPESSYWRRVRHVNRDQIRHHKVKRSQWLSLRGIPESVFCR